MPKTPTNPMVDAFVKQETAWPEATKKLRALALAFPLVEELKWGKPCYSYEGHNVVIIQGFKEYCALMFCKGALLKDPHHLLVKPGENTQAARQARFTHAREITPLAAILKEYIREAIAAEKSGLQVTYKKITDHAIPEEFQTVLQKNRAAKAAYESLTPGRQRAYLLYFSAAKQSATRTARIEKCLPKILKGEGLNDDYKR
jgi:uncharacterized protein YdeI (YjbR/CyaY-like superfamily)